MRLPLLVILAAIVLLLTPTPAPAGGRGEAKPPSQWETVKDGQEVWVSGTLRRVGTAAFNDLVVTDDDDMDWYIAPESKALLSDAEQRRVTVVATVRLRRIKLADGREFPSKRELVSVKRVE